MHLAEGMAFRVANFQIITIDFVGAKKSVQIPRPASCKVLLNLTSQCAVANWPSVLYSQSVLALFSTPPQRYQVFRFLWHNPLRNIPETLRFNPNCIGCIYANALPFEIACMSIQKCCFCYRYASPTGFRVGDWCDCATDMSALWA